MKKQKGIILPITVIMLSGILAMAGLALDTGNALNTYRTAQTAADAAALSAAYEQFYGRSEQVTTAAHSAASANGFTHGDSNIAVTVNHPPTSGFYNGDNASVEVIISQPTPSIFLKVLGINSLDISVRAVANTDLASSDNCIYVLDNNSHEKSFYVSGSDSALDADCGILINSKHSKGASVESGACVRASTVTVIGGYDDDECKASGFSSKDSFQCSDSATCPMAGKKLPDDQDPLPAPDPLAGIPAPPVDRGSCDYAGEKDGSRYKRYEVSGGNKTIRPGQYCGGILIKDVKATMEPGTYILRGGGLVVDGSDTKLTGTDVSIYNTCYQECDGNESDEQDFWPLDVKSGGTVNLSAPPCNGGNGTQCSGALDGILFFSDRNAPSSSGPQQDPTNRIGSTSTATLNGAIYIHNQFLRIDSTSGGSSTSNAIIVAKFLDISSNSRLTIRQPTGSSGGSPIKKVTLVE